MMVFTKVFYSLCFSCCVLSFVSCTKKGCTDQYAENFDDEAKKSDHSCTYVGDMVFWYGEQTSEQLVTSGATGLRYFLDNELVGSSAADVYFTGAPECGQNGSISVTKALGGNSQGAFAYRVEDQLGLTRFEGIVNLSGGRCAKKELTP